MALCLFISNFSQFRAVLSCFFVVLFVFDSCAFHLHQHFFRSFALVFGWWFELPLEKMTSPGDVATGSSGHRVGMASQAIGVGGEDACRMGRGVAVKV